jgi:hypothetical protein
MAGKMVGRPLLQNLVKSAMVASADRVRISNEAHLQSIKTAEEEKDAKCEHCGKGKEKCSCGGKCASGLGQHVEKLASALDFMAEVFLKEGADLKGQYKLEEGIVPPPPGVLEAISSESLPDHKGQGVNTVPMHPGMQKAMPGEHGATQLANTQDAPPVPLKSRMPENIVNEKRSSVVSFIRKVAEETEEHSKKVEHKETKGLNEAKKGLDTAREAHFKEEPENAGEKESSAKTAGPKIEAIREAFNTLKGHGERAAKAVGQHLENVGNRAALHVHGDSSHLGTRRGNLGKFLHEHAKAVGGTAYGAGAAGIGAAGVGAHHVLKKKESSVTDYMRWYTKQAEDAINPAQISAGAAVPPDTSAAGEAGGEPVGGAPHGPSGLVGSAESAINYTRGQAYSPRKGELGKYFDEPALSAQHDSVLQDAFVNTGKAGPKIAAQVTEGSNKAAAARALLSKLASANENSSQAVGA